MSSFVPSLDFLTNLGDGLGLGSGDASGIYGKKPEIPDYPTLEKAQRDAIASNKAVIPDATEIGAKVNEFNQDQLEKMLRHAMPWLDDLNNRAVGVIQSQLKGELPPDVAALIERKTAERSVAGGFSGSGVGRNLTARDLGLTSLQLTQQGLSSAERWIAQARNYQTAPLFDVTSMFVSPAQQFAASEGKFQRDLLAANIKAAPDPVKRGQFDSEMALIGMVLSAYGGGAGYTGQYRAPAAATNGGGAGATAAAAGGGSNYLPYNPPERSSPQSSPDYSFSLY